MYNANLSILKVKKGKLQPDFNPGNYPYLDAPIPFSDSASPAYNDKQSNSLIADPEIQLAKITINGTPVENGAEYVISNLAVGSNSVEIIVTSADGSNSNMYTVNMYRAIPIFKTGAGSYSGINPLEDGATQRGVSWPSPRFKDNGNGTVTDLLTGLMWSQNDNLILSDFDSSVAAANNLILGGYDDWRLPNVLELTSLISFNTTFQNYLSPFFSGITNTRKWWTSTINNSNMGLFFTSSDSIIEAISPSSFYSTWAVRDINPVSPVFVLPKTKGKPRYSGDDGNLQKGVEWPDPRFYTEIPGAVVDNMTSLMWFPVYEVPSPSPGGDNWYPSINWIKERINSGIRPNYGYSDWVLPNVNEIKTLANYSASDINWLNPFISIYIYPLWTSTSKNNSFAFYFYPDNQLINSDFKASYFNILPVRQARIINY